MMTGRREARRSDVTVKRTLRLGANRLMANYGIEISRTTDLVAASRRIVVHPLVKGMPAVALASEGPRGRADDVTTRRLMDAYNNAIDEERSAKLRAPSDDLWTNLVNTELSDLLQILQARDVQALSEFLAHFGEEYTWAGGLCLTVDGYTPPQAETGQVALTYLDKLVCLAESLGVLDVENPEQSVQWGANLYHDIDDLVEQIEVAIGIPIAPPVGVIPVDGLSTARGPLHYRYFNALYAALRVRALVHEDSGVCEYGGGLGLVAHYARQLGMRDYTLYDLPLSNLFAGHYLIGTLGAEAVRLHGEDPRPGTVSVLPYWSCLDAPAGAFELALNQDSFPEIDPTLVGEYIRQIERTTSKYFLSINQEARAAMGSRRQNSVPALIRDHAEFHRMYRMQYWIREGYVEELYELRRARA